jgi:hypothetical protein
MFRHFRNTPAAFDFFEAGGGDGEDTAIFGGEFEMAHDYVDFCDAPCGVFVVYPGAFLGNLAAGFAVEVVFVGEAAEEAAAGAGDFHGVEGQVLVLGHFDGHGLEFVRDCVAAVAAAANPQAAHDPGLVPDADLAQLYPHLEDAHEVLYQLPKIHPVFRSKEKKYLRFLKQIMNRDQLHFQPVGFNFFFADLESVLCLIPVIGGPFQVLL